jgi:hypothetical protein
MPSHRKSGPRWPWLAGAVALALAPVLAASPFSRREADSFERKRLEILSYSRVPQRGARVTPFSESEVNSYIHFELAPELPTGVRDPAVDIIGEGRLSGEATVDLDRVRESKASGRWFDPLNMLTGRLRVAASGVLASEGGLARFTLEEATVAGVPVPKAVLQELVTYYSRSPAYPDGVSLDDAFPLPARIREIDVRPDQAIVIQR